MSVLPVGIGSSGVDVGDIGHSLRLRSASSARLSRTPSAAPTRRQVTFSFWFKRGTLGVSMRLFQTRDNGGSSANAFGIYLNAANELDVYQYSSAYTLLFRTSAVFRDPTSWNHLVVAIDTTQATSADRVKLYLNGNALTSSTYTAPALNLDLYWDSAVQHNIGCFDFTGTYNNFFDGDFARIAVVSQQQLTPSSFGYQNTEINEWVSKSQSAVKAVVDAGGTNSFMLDFDDATSLTTLGYDKSSKGNNWTLNNVSLTAGSTYDWMLDVPGNSFATLNPLMFRYSLGHATKSEANLKTTNPSGVASSYDWSTFAVASGKWYAEGVWTTTGTGGMSFGVDSGLAQYSTFTDSVTYLSNGTKNVGASNTSYGATYAVNDVIGIALDKDANTVTFYKNNVSQGAISLPNTAAPMFFHSGLPASGAAVFNFGQRPFAYTPPTGFKALCQANLPDPAILNPELHFDVRTRTGTAATYSVTDLLFQPDLAWIKSRGRAVDHALYDSVRGVQKQLESNQTGAETTETTGLTAFNSNGYTGGTLDQINGTTATNSFVDWFWKAGGAAVTNNAGSISSQVSANADAGFSIVTYTGTGANATVGHGLSGAPELIIHKNRNVAYDWPVWHKALLGTEYLMLNTTAAKATDTTLWNSSTPTTTTFPLGTDAKANYNQQVALCFHSVPGFSKIGSYTGNGSADGPYVECGFKPKYVMVKRTDSTGSWQVFDSIRAGYNVDNDQLVANTSAAEVTTDLLDLTANGFKPRSTSTEVNASSGTYIFLAVADVPAKYSLAR